MGVVGARIKLVINKDRQSTCGSHAFITHALSGADRNHRTRLAVIARSTDPITTPEHRKTRPLHNAQAAPILSRTAVKKRTAGFRAKRQKTDSIRTRIVGADLFDDTALQPLREQVVAKAAVVVAKAVRW